MFGAPRVAPRDGSTVRREGQIWPLPLARHRALAAAMKPMRKEASARR